MLVRYVGQHGEGKRTAAATYVCWPRESHACRGRGRGTAPRPHGVARHATQGVVGDS